MLTGESVPAEAGAGRIDLRGCAGPARRSHREGDPDRVPHQIRPHGGAGAHRPRRELPAEGRPPGRAQPRAVQRRHHHRPGGLRHGFTGTGLGRDHRLLLTAVLAAIPVALPATFTLATALGARSLAKTGRPFDPPFRGGRGGDHGRALLGQDRNPDPQRIVRERGPADPRLRRGARPDAGRPGQRGWRPGPRRRRHSCRRPEQRSARIRPSWLKFIPFDPAKKMSEASATDDERPEPPNRERRVRHDRRPDGRRPHRGRGRRRTGKRGLPGPGVAAGPPGQPMPLVGLVSLSDPPRSDSPRSSPS
jgi:hypothetical protein